MSFSNLIYYPCIIIDITRQEIISLLQLNINIPNYDSHDDAAAGIEQQLYQIVEK